MRGIMMALLRQKAPTYTFTCSGGGARWRPLRLALAGTLDASMWAVRGIFTKFYIAASNSGTDDFESLKWSSHESLSFAYQATYV